jgi:hypothetical protein
VATQYYPQLGLRPILQLELLLAPEEATRAGSLVARRGWQIEARTPGRTTRVVESGGGVAALLYEGVPAYVCGPEDPAATLAALREGSSEQRLAGTAARVPAPADELLFGCALGARRTLAPGIQWLVDVHHVQGSGAVDAERLAARARAQRLTLPLRETLSYLGTTTGFDTAAVASEGVPPSRRERLVHALAANGLGRLGLAPAGLLEYARATLDQPFVPAVRGLPGALRDTWELEGVGQVPSAAVAKLIRRARRGQPSPRGRSRSASS